MEKCEMAERKLYKVVVDLIKAVDHVPREVIWWARKKRSGGERNKGNHGNGYDNYDICD